MQRIASVSLVLLVTFQAVTVWGQIGANNRSQEGPSGAFSASGTAREDTPKGQPTLLARQVITDPARGNMPAYEIFVPEGWKVEGGVSAVPPAYHMIPYLSDINIKAPDKRGVRFFGINEFGYADGVQMPPYTPYMGRPFFPLVQSLGEFWSILFQMNPAPGITNLRVVSETVLPDATALVRRQLAGLYQATAQENAQIAAMGQHKEFDVQARQLVLEYEDEGQPVEATVFATARHSIYRNSFGMITAAMWTLDNMYVVYGPAGTDYLNDPVLAAVLRAKRTDPQWQSAIQQWYMMKNRQIVAEGRAKIAAAAQAAASQSVAQSKDVLDISFEGWKKRNEMNNAGHAASIQGIHERTTYTTPLGGNVELPSYYKNVYTDNLGNYILHNDANYEVNQDPNFNSREWHRVEPQ